MYMYMDVYMYMCICTCVLSCVCAVHCNVCVVYCVHVHVLCVVYVLCMGACFDIASVFVCAVQCVSYETTSTALYSSLNCIRGALFLLASHVERSLGCWSRLSSSSNAYEHCAR
jgi:hypothetical protein